MDAVWQLDTLRTTMQAQVTPLFTVHTCIYDMFCRCRAVLC